MIARPVPGRPAPGGGLAVLVVVTVLAVLAAPQLGRLRPLVDRLREVDPPRSLMRFSVLVEGVLVVVGDQGTLGRGADLPVEPDGGVEGEQALDRKSVV